VSGKTPPIKKGKEKTYGWHTYSKKKKRVASSLKKDRGGGHGDNSVL